MMRVPLLAVAALALLGCGDSSLTVADPPGVTTVDVFTPGNIFSPFTTTVPVGGTVRFNITGVSHNVIFARTAPGAPSDINEIQNVVISRTFGVKGTFSYDCTIHPGMSGQVVVQ